MLPWWGAIWYINIYSLLQQLHQCALIFYFCTNLSYGFASSTLKVCAKHNVKHRYHLLKSAASSNCFCNTSRAWLKLFVGLINIIHFFWSEYRQHNQRYDYVLSSSYSLLKMYFVYKVNSLLTESHSSEPALIILTVTMNQEIIEDATRKF